MITVYLSNSTIRLAIGKATGKGAVVSELISEQCAEGILQNGTILNKQAFGETLRDIWAKNTLPQKDVTLVIDSNQFITKIIEAPMLNRSGTTMFVKNEFSTVERMNDPIYSYTVLTQDKKTKMQSLIAVAAERGFISEYISVFEEAGIQVVSIRTALSGAIKLLSESTDIKNRSCLVQIFCDEDVTNILFLKGKYTYSSKSRLFEKRGSSAYAAEVSRSVNNILQFVKARQDDINVTDVYMCGIPEDDFYTCKEAIGIVSTTLNVSEFNPGQSISAPQTGGENLNEYFYAVCGLTMLDKYSDLISKQKQNGKTTQDVSELISMSKPVAFALGAMLIILSVLFGATMITQSKINKIYEYTKDPDIVAQCDEYDRLNAEIIVLQSYVDAVRLTKTDMATYPVPDSKVKSVLDRCASGLVKISITKYDSQRGILTLNSTAKNVKLVNQFIELLRKEDDCFSVVTYTGYTYRESDDVWIVNVVCYLAQTAGREVVEND